MRQLCRSCKYLGLVISFVVTGSGRTSGGLGQDDAFAIHKADYCRLVKNVLIVSGKEEDAITPKRPSGREPELMLLTARIEAKFGITRGKAAVSQIVEAGSMKFI